MGNMFKHSMCTMVALIGHPAGRLYRQRHAVASAGGAAAVYLECMCVVLVHECGDVLGLALCWDLSSKWYTCSCVH